MEQAAFYPEFQTEYGTGRSPSSTANDEQGYYLDENNERALDPNAAAFGPKFDPNVSLKWWDGSTRPWVASNKGIYDELFRTGYQQVANVALSSGNDKGSVRFSYTNTQYSPITPGAKYDKNAFSFSTSYDLNDKISVKYSGNYYVTENLNSPFAGSLDAQGARASLGAYSADIDVDLLRSYMVTDNGFDYFASPSRINFISAGRSSVVGSLWDWTAK